MDRSQLKAAFIRDCVNRGITEPADIAKAAEKAASSLEAAVEKKAFIGSTLGAIGNFAGTVLDTVGPAAILAPPVIGGGLGLAYGRSAALPSKDKEKRKAELIKALRQETLKLTERTRDVAN